ncbi:hypothetical protein B0H11DRAFT_2247182 [Mycena galericulata]|nr:hypothetical protein B0H11DRAFT_2247182 [Mycena galericulata]
MSTTTTTTTTMEAAPHASPSHTDSTSTLATTTTATTTTTTTPTTTTTTTSIPPTSTPPMARPSTTRVRFDAECVLIPDVLPSKRPRMLTKSYSLPLWRRRDRDRDDEEQRVIRVALPRWVPCAFVCVHSFARSFVHSPFVSYRSCVPSKGDSLCLSFFVATPSPLLVCALQLPPPLSSYHPTLPAIAMS